MIRLILLVVMIGFDRGSSHYYNIDDFMACRPITTMFGVGVGVNKTNIPILQGLPGDAGDRGDSGRTGKVAQFSDFRLSKIVETRLAKIREQTSKAKAMLRSMGIDEDSLSKEFGDSFAKEYLASLKCMKRFGAPISEEENCFKLIQFKESLNLTFSKRECRKLGGRLADVNSRELYSKLYDYVDKTFGVRISAWTGMEVLNEELYLRSGQKAEYAKFQKHYPESSRYYRHVQIDINPSAAAVSVKNVPEYRRAEYGVCQFSVNKQQKTST